jgi:hypothetical protein
MTTRNLSELNEAAAAMPDSAIEAVTRAMHAGGDPQHAALLARAMNAVAISVSRIGRDALADVVAAPTDHAVLLGLLKQPEVVEEIAGIDPLGRARLRGLEARARLLEAEGGTMNAEEVGALLGGISRQAVDKRRRAGKLFALPAGERSWRYPVWQLEAEGGVLPGLEEVLRNFGVEDPWTRAAFLLGGNDRLSGKRPLDALREGLVEDVARAARSVGEHGAD